MLSTRIQAMLMMLLAFVLFAVPSTATDILEPVVKPAPSAGSPAASPDGGHGWVLADALVGDGAVLIHIPPRVRGVDPALPREIHRSARLKIRPEGLAAWGARVWALVPPDEGSDARTVYEQRVIPSPAGAMWLSSPSGSMRLLTSLENSGRFLGMAAGPAGPIVATGDMALTIHAWTGSGWQERAAPKVLASKTVGFYQSGAGVALLWKDENDELQVSRAPFGDDANEDWVWTTETIDAASADVILSASAVLTNGSGLTLVDDATDGVEVSLFLAGRLVPGPRLDVSGPGWSAALLDADARVALVWTEAVENGEGAGSGFSGQPVPRQHMIAEVSIASLRVLDQGVAGVRAPVSKDEFRSLAIAVFLLGAGVLVLVVKAGDETIASMPKGWALASRGQRLTAFAIDSIIPVSIAAMIHGDVAVVLGPLLPGAGFSDLWPLTTALLIGFVIGVVSEGTIGRSPGKAFLRLSVVDTRPGIELDRPQRLGFTRSLLRNAVKWLLPPIAAVGVIGPVGRHRGDALSGACVVRRAEPGATDAP